MAKRKVTAPATADLTRGNLAEVEGKTAEPAVIVISAATKRLIAGVRLPFTGFVAGMNNLLATRAKLAPAFMKAARAWQKETEGTFVGFVRELDPSVPKEMKGYRDNAVYNAAVYLKRLVTAHETGKGKAAEEREGPAPLPPMAGMARLIAAIQPLVAPEQLTKLWDIIAHEMHWNDGQREKLQALVKEAEPLIAVRKPKGGVRPILLIAQPRHFHVDGPTTGEATIQ